MRLLEAPGENVHARKVKMRCDFREYGSVQ